MALEKVGQYNDLSPKLRKLLEEKIEALGAKVRVRFSIEKQNSDPEKKTEKIYPFRWTLDPVTFQITDPHEDREGKGRENASRLKKIGIVEASNEKGEPDRFRRIRVEEMDKGVRTFNMNKPEEYEDVFYLLIHPKLTGGLFADKEKVPVITIVDEQKTAEQERKQRSQRREAMDFAEKMTNEQIKNFADAMSGEDAVKWDSTQNPGVLRNTVEALAETNPVFFNDLVRDKKLEFQATLKQAVDKGIITFNIGEYKFVWTSTNQPIAVLQPTADKNEIQQLAEYFITGGEKVTAIYERIKAMVKGEKQVPETVS